MSFTKRERVVLRRMNEGYLPSLNLRNKLVNCIKDEHTEEEAKAVKKFALNNGYFNDSGVGINEGLIEVKGTLLKMNGKLSQYKMLVEGDCLFT